MVIFDSRRPILIVVAVALPTVLLIGTFIANGLAAFAVVAVALAALWLLGWRRGLGTPIDLGFAGMVGLAALGTIASTGRLMVMLVALLILAATACALAAWDLMRFDLRLRTFASLKDLPGLATETETGAPPNLAGLVSSDARLQRDHLQRVAIVTGVGLTAGALAIVLRTQLPFVWIALVLLLALLLFTLSLRELRADA